MKRFYYLLITAIVSFLLLGASLVNAEEPASPIKPVGILVHPLLIKELQKTPASGENEGWISVVNSPSEDGLPVAIVTAKNAATVDGKALFLKQASLKETATMKKGTVPVLDVLERRNNWYQVGLYTADFDKYGMIGWVKYDGKGFADISHFEQKPAEKEKK